MTFFHIHRIMSFTGIIKEASSSSRWEVKDSQPVIMQRNIYLEYSALNEMTISNSSPQNSGNPKKEEMER